MNIGFWTITLLAAAGAFALITGPVTGVILGFLGAGFIAFKLVDAHEQEAQRKKAKKQAKKQAKKRAQLLKETP